METPKPVINHNFISADGHWKLNLTSSFISLSTVAYAGWESFGKQFDLPLVHFIRIYKPAFFERIGLPAADTGILPEFSPLFTAYFQPKTHSGRFQRAVELVGNRPLEQGRGVSVEGFQAQITGLGTPGAKVETPKPVINHNFISADGQKAGAGRPYSRKGAGPSGGPLLCLCRFVRDIFQNILYPAVQYLTEVVDRDLSVPSSVHSM